MVTTLKHLSLPWRWRDTLRPRRSRSWRTCWRWCRPTDHSCVRAWHAR